MNNNAALINILSSQENHPVEDLSSLEIDLYNAAVKFAEQLKSEFKGATFEAVMQTVPGSTCRGIWISNLGGTNSTNYKASLVYDVREKRLSFPKNSNTDIRYQAFISEKVPASKDLVERL